MKMTHEDLKKAIQNKYSHPHWITLCEVSDASGFDGSRSIDVVAFGLYSSRGWEVHAFECKAFRSDWLKELRSPDKAETFHAIVDKFWIVAPKNVVRKEELPRGWGLIIVSGEGAKLRARVSVQATKIDATQDSLPRPFVAAMLTRMQKELDHYHKHSVLRESIRKELNAKKEEGIKIGMGNSLEGQAIDDLKKLEKNLKVFEEASGITINRYSSQSPLLGERVKIIMQLDRGDHWNGFIKRTRDLVETLRKDAASLEKCLANSEKMQDRLKGGDLS